jgi:hypothetical protein
VRLRQKTQPPDYACSQLIPLSCVIMLALQNSSPWAAGDTASVPRMTRMTGSIHGGGVALGGFARGRGVRTYLFFQILRNDPPGARHELPRQPTSGHTTTATAFRHIAHIARMCPVWQYSPPCAAPHSMPPVRQPTGNDGTALTQRLIMTLQRPTGTVRGVTFCASPEVNANRRGGQMQAEVFFSGFMATQEKSPRDQQLSPAA